MANQPDVNEAPRLENMLRVSPSQNRYIKGADRRRIADLLSDTHKHLVEVGKMDIRDATDEFRKKQAELTKLLEEERKFIDNL